MNQILSLSINLIKSKYKLEECETDIECGKNA